MFSKTTEYALRAVIYIARNSSEERKLSVAEITDAINAPQHFTAKILQQLTADQRIVSSVRGPNGGFFMTAKSRKLPVMEILKLLGEDSTLDKCILGLAECSGKKPCPLHAQYKLIKQQLLDLFKTKRIVDLTEELASGRAFISLDDK